MANHNKKEDLVDEKQALSLFFTDLLTDTDETSSENNQAEGYKTDNTVFLPTIPIEISEENVEVVKPQKRVVEEIIAEPETKLSNPVQRDKDEAFQIMMFKTAGLTLAVPLVELSGVITWPETITEMPGHKESYLGIVQHLDHKIPIIDIAQIVFPQDRIAELVTPNSNERLQRIVFINDFEWGLACDAVNDVITIEAEQVKWRKPGSQRAWLAGTVVEYMCALLDTCELSKLLNSDSS